MRQPLAGAGGHGDPFERDPELVAADVADGKISPTVARAEYGVVLDTATGVLDVAASEALRASRHRA